MSKKMKSPEKMPPNNSGLKDGDGNAITPKIEVPETAAAALGNAFNAPTLEPPVRVETVAAAIGADVWNSDKRVNALYTTFNAHNSWMNVPGLGWKKLATGSDSMCEAMTLLASHCREKNCRIDFSEENGLVKEMYVW